MPRLAEVVLADFGDRAPQLRADVLDQVAFVADQFGVVHVEMNFASGGSSPDLRARAAAPDDDQILAQRFHVLFLVDDKASPQADQQDHGRDSPHESEHREERPHLVRPERGYGLSKDF